MTDLVKSVELVQYSLATASGAVTLTKGQDVANCVPFTTAHGGSDYPDSNIIDTWFSASGTVTFQRSNTRSTTMTVNCYVVEFYPSEVHVQQEYFEILNGTAAGENIFYPAESFVDANTGLIFGYSSSSTSQYMADHFIRGRVTTVSGGVSFYKSTTDGNIIGHYYLFDAVTSGISVQHLYSSFTGTEQVLEANTTDWYRSFVLGSHACSDIVSGGLDKQACVIQPYNMGTVRCYRATGTGTIYWASQIIKFNDAKLHVFDKYSALFNTTDGSSFTKSLNEVGVPEYDSTLRWGADTSCPISTSPQGIAKMDTTTAAAIDHLFTSFTLPNNYSITFTRISNAYATRVSYSIVDWVGVSVSTGSNSTPMDPSVTFVKSVESGRMIVKYDANMVKLTRGQTIANCVVFATYRVYGATSDVQREHITCVCLSDTNVLYAKRVGDTYTICVDYNVVEFYPDQIKVQSGTTLVFDDGVTLTKEVSIEPVTLNKAFLVSTSNSSATTTYWSRHMYRARFVDSDTIDFYKPFSGNNSDISWFIVEDIAGNNFECEHLEGTTTASTWQNSDKLYEYRRTFLVTSSAVATDTSGPSYCVYRAYFESGWSCPVYFHFNGASYTKYYFSTAILIIRDVSRFYCSHIVETLSSTAASITTTYTSDFGGYNNLSIVPSSCSSVGGSSSTGATGISAAFLTARITNYTDRTIEISSYDNASTTRYAGYVVVNWEGVPTVRGYDFSTDTKSLIKSIQKTTINSSGIDWDVLPSKKQDVTQCLPLMSWTLYAADAVMGKMFPPIRTIPEYDRFNIRLRNTPDAASTINVTILEFPRDQVKIQHGYVMLNGTSVTVTIDSVDLSKTFLRFYISPETTNSWDGVHIAHKWLSSTQIEFSCIVDRGRVAITYYVVECLQDQWSVQHIWQDFNSAATDYYLFPTNFVDNSTGVFFVSSSIAVTSSYTNAGGLRVAMGVDAVINVNRTTATANMRIISAEFIEFNSELGFRTFEVWINLGTAAVSATTNLLLSGRELDLNRALIINPRMDNLGRGSSGTSTYADTCICSLDFQDNNTARATRYRHSGTSANIIASIIEIPEFNTYYVDGTVLELEVPIQRAVRLYRADTGGIMDEATSASGTGYFRLETSYSGAHYVVCLDDGGLPDYNDLIYGNVMPTVISGTFPYNEGWVS